jgi:hypothetical protein
MKKKVNEGLEQQVNSILLEHLYSIEIFGANPHNYQVPDSYRMKWTRRIMELFGYEATSDYSHINHAL